MQAFAQGETVFGLGDLQSVSPGVPIRLDARSGLHTRKPC